MAIALQRFCLNRKIAPSLSIEAFFRLVNSLGLNKVELRNDLPTGKVTDDLSHQQVRELADRYHIEILTINAVYPFNRRTEQVRGLAESLLQEARAIGAKSLVLCPLNDGSEVRCAICRRCFRFTACGAWLNRWVSRRAHCDLRHRRRRSSAMRRYRLSY